MEGVSYSAFVIDAFSRKVVGWADQIGVGTAAIVPTVLTVLTAGTADTAGADHRHGERVQSTVDPVHGNDLATESTKVLKTPTRACQREPTTIIGAPETG